MRTKLPGSSAGALYVFRWHPDSGRFEPKQGAALHQRQTHSSPFHQCGAILYVLRDNAQIGARPWLRPILVVFQAVTAMSPVPRVAHPCGLARSLL